MSLSHLPKGRFCGTGGGRTKVLFAFIVRLQLRSISVSFLLFMPLSIASINSIAFVPYKRLGVVSEFIYGVLNYLYVKYLMRDIYIYMRYTYISTIIEYDLLEEIFRLLNSLKSFIFISTTKRIKNDFEKKTLLLYVHIYIHTIFISDKFLQY